MMNQINDLNSQVNSLNSKVEALESKRLGFTNPPAYDSYWFGLSAGQWKVFEHNLHTADLVVYMMGRKPGDETVLIHQMHFGTMEYANGAYSGAMWLRLNDTHVSVYRHVNDWNWQVCRLLIWEIIHG